MATVTDNEEPVKPKKRGIQPTSFTIKDYSGRDPTRVLAKLAVMLKHGEMESFKVEYQDPISGAIYSIVHDPSEDDSETSHSEPTD